MTELGNESEIHNGSILLFPPREKQEVSPSHPIAPFKSFSLICHKEQRREEICTTEDLSDSAKEFKSVRLISHGLHLNEHGIGKLALNFVKRIRSLRNSGSAK